VDAMLARMDEVVPMQPDIVCLPEAFPYVGLTSGRPEPTQVAERPLGRVSGRIAEFARQHRCHVVCPIYTLDEGRCYNAAVIIDRQGRYVGEYRKINPTDGELAQGIVPGPLEPPVFDLDMGRVGVQICYDINWHANWGRLADAGAEIVFWPSAFAGGGMLNALAQVCHYYIVGSTRFEHPTKIVDPLGADIVATGRASEWVCAPVNLDVAVVQTVSDIRKLEAVRAKYGRRFNVRIRHVEAWALIEGLSDEISVPQVLAEFGIETSRQALARNTALQDAARP